MNSLLYRPIQQGNSFFSVNGEGEPFPGKRVKKEGNAFIWETGKGLTCSDKSPSFFFPFGPFFLAV